MFIDGGFRWESGIQSFRASRTKRAKIVLPQLAQKVDPVYPMEAAANHVSGTVRVYFVIGADGVVHNPHAIKDAGFSEDPYLVKAAEDAVRQWWYLPLTIDGKPTEMDSQADVVFAGKN
jgi:TonB family protein